MVLYHGCSDQSLSSNDPNGIVVTGGPHNINPAVGAKRPDFGPGFYTTTWLHQARNWANNRVIKLRARHHPHARAVVLSMQVRRNIFANLQTLVFPSERDNFHTFVLYCRNGGIAHAPLAYRTGLYDVIAGPVTLAGQTMIVGGADQVSFHTAAVAEAISNVVIHEIGYPTFDVSR